jgi:hypothetical protein
VGSCIQREEHLKNDMTDRQLYVTLFSSDSQDLYPDNKLAAFTSELAQPISLNPDYEWEVGLAEVSCVPPARGSLPPRVQVGSLTLLIYCDIITPQFVGKNLVRCLRSIIHPTQDCEFTFDQVFYLPVENKTFKNIRIEILKLDGLPVNFKDSENPVKVVLHFRRVEKNTNSSIIYKATSSLFHVIYKYVSSS